MSLAQDTYTAFMLDHAAGQQNESLTLAGHLHTLLSDVGADMNDIWCMAAKELMPAAQNGSNARTQDDLNAACRLLANGFDNIEWRRGLFGVHYSKTKVSGGNFMKLEPGNSVPRHGHRKLEATVVLEGELSDGNGGLYEKGDLLLGVPGVRHKPAAYGSYPCICFVAKA